MKRIFEPSTWAGLAGLVLGLKLFVSPQWHPVVDAVSATAGGLAVALREKGQVL